MCLYFKETKPIKKIADKDIVCYKLVLALKNVPCEYYWNFGEKGSLQSKNDYYYFTPFQYYGIAFNEKLSCTGKTTILQKYEDDIFECYNNYYNEALTDEEKNEIHSLFLSLENTVLFEDKSPADIEIAVNNGSFFIAHSGITAGVFHSFVNLEDTKKFLDLNGEFHNYAEFMTPDQEGDFLTIAKCIIPKGSEYYEGVFEMTGVKSYGSKDIIYQEIVKKDK
jgi:hypothetical protein